MSHRIIQFERHCKAAGVVPTAALKAGGVHPSLWKKWIEGRFSPTLRNFEAAEAGLALIAPRLRVHFPSSSPVVKAKALSLVNNLGPKAELASMASVEGCRSCSCIRSSSDQGRLDTTVIFIKTGLAKRGLVND